MDKAARFQVTEVKHGYAVRDTSTGSIWGITYKRAGMAARAAVRLNGVHGQRRYF